jgi:hypothetical protein
MAVLSLDGETGMKLGKRRVWQAAICLLCVVVAQRNSLGLEGKEFSGGRVTGRVLDLSDAGSLLFVLALFLTFAYPRVAAAIAIVALPSLLLLSHGSWPLPSGFSWGILGPAPS